MAAPLARDTADLRTRRTNASHLRPGLSSGRVETGADAASTTSDRRGKASTARTSGLRSTAPDSSETSRQRLSALVCLLALAFIALFPIAGGFQWVVSNIHIDIGDMVFLPLLAALAIFTLSSQDKTTNFWRQMPWRWVWYAWGLLIAVSYAKSDAFFGGVGTVYQFYRYCWKPMLFYPVVLYLVARPTGLRLLAAAIILTTDVNAIASIWQGRTVGDVRGFLSLSYKNMLAGSMLAPAFLALSESMHGFTAVRRWTARVSGLLIGASFWYTQSRGAFVGASVGAVAYLLVSPKRWRFAAMGLAVITAVLLIYPDFGESSGIRKRFNDIGNGTQSQNLAWRMKERWPHFMAMAAEHPWFGVGRAEDIRLGSDTNTPHNGFIALAVKFGFPAAACYVFLLIAALLRALALTRERFPLQVRGLGAGVFGGLVALSVHNFVDTTFEGGAVAYSFWILAGIVMGLDVAPQEQSPVAEQVQPSFRTRRTPDTPISAIS